MTASPASITVVGAGIVGVSSALYMQRAGFAVTVLDALPPGGGASYGNAGLISVEACIPVSMPGMLKQVPRWLMDPLGPLAVRPSYFPTALPWLLRWVAAGRRERVFASSDALRALHVPAIDCYRELLGSGFNDLIRLSGQVHVWESSEPSPSEAMYHELCRLHGVVAEPLTREALKQLVPELASPSRAVFLPKNGYTVNPQRLVETLARLFVEAGGVVRHERVLKLIPESGAWRIVTNLGNHHCGKLLVSAGAWSAQLLRPLGIRLPLETERGYHLTIRNPNVVPRLPVLSRGRGFTLTPMEGGLRLAGTVEIGGLDLPMSEARALVLLEHAQAMLPGLEAPDYAIWMGFRPSFPDSLPVIGETLPGLYVAFGHGHTGMTGGPPTGHLVKQLIAGETPAIDLAPFSPARFR